MSELVNIGKVSGTHHLKGDLKVTTLLEEIEVLEGNKVIFQNRIGDKKLFTVKSTSYMNSNKIILSIEEIKGIDEARKYIGYELYIRRELLGEITEDEYYLVDLVGMQVITESGEILGKIITVETTGAHDIYVIDYNDKEIMIPAVDEFVKKVDFEKKQITVKLIDGML